MESLIFLADCLLIPCLVTIKLDLDAEYDGFWMEDFLQVSTDFSCSWNFSSMSTLMEAMSHFSIMPQ